MYEEELTLEERVHRLETRPIHKVRWIALALWIIIFTVIVFWAIRANRSNVSGLKHAKATVSSLNYVVERLNKTNCGLKRFLEAARDARQSAASHSTGSAREENSRAANSYQRLIDLFPHDNCDQLLGGTG